jgi:Histidine kinase-like ATPase domain
MAVSGRIPPGAVRGRTGHRPPGPAIGGTAAGGPAAAAAPGGPGRGAPGGPPAPPAAPAAEPHRPPAFKPSSGPRPRSAGRRPAHEGRWLFTAPALDSSVPQLRHAVRDLLVRQAVPVGAGTLDGLLLIVSELVTNAVRHAAVLSPRITVEIEVGAGQVSVGVGDDHPYGPKALEADHTRIGGRGLLLVQAIAAEAGGRCEVEHIPAGGKVVRAALPLDL